jgi:Alpha/beta hydrolase family
MTSCRRLLVLGALFAAAFGAAADTARQVPSTLVIGGNQYDVAWGLPAGTPVGLAVVEHGFTRRCANIAGTLEALVAQGLVTLCVDANMTAGNPQLADALAQLLVAGVSTPDGVPVPERIVVGGHSAGGAFAVRLGFTLAQLAPQRLAGAVLFDPVAAAGFSDQIRALAGDGARPVRSLSALPGGCNAQLNALPGLRAVAADAAAAGADPFIGVQLTDRSTHVDAEGSDSDVFAWAACRQGPPRPANVRTLRELAAVWAADLALARRSADYYPGGAVLENLRQQERLQPLE